MADFFYLCKKLMQMRRTYIFCLMLMAVCVSVLARERSYTITFGAPSASTTTLNNGNFMTAVKEGASFIGSVTSVVAVFPETDAIRLSSQKTDGKFNIHLAESAQVVATRIVVEACRYESDCDAEASIMLNGETLFIPSPEPELYTLAIPSRPEKLLTNLIVDADHRIYLRAVTVYYDDSQGTVEPVMETVKTPAISPAGGTITSGTQVSIGCPTEGADIYYTIDGSEPTTASTRFLEPFAVYHDLRVRAFAVKEGMKPSEMADATFTVRNPEAELVSVFDFAHPGTLSPAVEAPAVSTWVDLDGRTFTDGDVAITFASSATGNTHVRLYGSYDQGTDLRLYDEDAVTVRSLNSAYTIRAITVTISLSGADSDAWFIADPGEWVWEADSWTPGDEPAAIVDLVSYRQSRITSMTVTLEQTGETALDLDVAPVLPALYYNLQGVPVSSPRTGVYVKKQGDSTEKILIRSGR